MLIIGLVLILVAAALGFGAVYDGGESATVEVFGATREISFSAAFLIGAATMLLLLVGLRLLTSSMGRARRKRIERKEVKQRHRDSVARLEDERTQLQAENERLSEQLGRSDAAAHSDRSDRAADTERIAGAGRQESMPSGVETAGGQGVGTPADRYDAGTQADRYGSGSQGDRYDSGTEADRYRSGTETGAAPAGVDPSTERGAHARHESDLRDAERSSTSPTWEGRT